MSKTNLTIKRKDYNIIPEEDGIYNTEEPEVPKNVHHRTPYVRIHTVSDIFYLQIPKHY